MIQKRLFESSNIVDKAIERIKEFEPPEGYWLAFSGGKDSIVLYDLTKASKVKFEAHYNITTLDNPELVKFIVQQYPEVVRDKPEKSFWKYCVEKGLPLRQQRWCCEVLKEKGGVDRRVLTGCRWAESPRRAKQRKLVEMWGGKYSKQLINPIIDWKDEDVWAYIKGKKLSYCKLYDEGCKRLGCIACPMAGRQQQVKELEKYPHVKRMYEKTFIAVWEKKKSEGKTSVDRWANGKDMFEWWLTGKGEIKTEDNEAPCLQFQ